MAWYNNDWAYRFKITTDATKVDFATDDVLYDLSLAPAAFWSNVKSDGGDIRVTRDDEVTEVAREVSGFNQGSNLGSLWIRAIGLSTSVNTSYYVYYGNAGASEPAAGATFGKNNVWPSYLGVFHLDELAGPVNDSKANVVGTLVNTTAVNVAGQIRTSASFIDGSQDKITCGNNFGVSAASISTSCWIKPTTADSDMVFFGKIDAGGTTNGYVFRKASGTSRLRYTIADATAATSVYSNNSVITAGVFQHVAASYNGVAASFFVNGVAQGTPAMTRVPSNNTAGFTIGNHPNFDFHRFIGEIDEVRVSTSLRTQAFFATEFNMTNSPSTFFPTTGLQEALGGGLPFITHIGAKRI
jgi:hypothetical protein